MSSPSLFLTTSQHIASIFSSVSDYLNAKITVTALVSLYSFFFSVDKLHIMSALVFLIIFDLVTGVYAAKKTGEVIESRKMLKSAIKLAIYGLLVSASKLAFVAINIPQSWFISIDLEGIMIAFLAATELVSIIENAGKAGYAIPKKLLNTLQKYVNDEKVEEMFKQK